uniref:Silicon transport protein n=1 Tax=Skeletonema marinoi TaxID=267567 RepID=A0A173DWM2_9STRA|nr:silicon transport protein [Skeletonema marinoi]
MTDVEKKEELADAHDVKLTPFTIFRYAYSVCLLIFSIVLVISLMFTGNTKLAADVSPWAALFVCIAAVVWLSMIEGQQASLVGLPPVDPELYKDTHPVTYLNAATAFLGDNLDRYLMGRQFMVLLVVFIINLCGAPTSGDADVLGMPGWLKTIFLDVGLGMIIFTCQLGQLTTQVNASHCMLDFINNYFALFTLYTAMCIEFSGVMHSSYLIQNILSFASGKPIHSNEEPKKGFTLLFFWGRVLMSLAILGFSLAVVISALFQGRTMMAVKYPNVSNGASVFLFFFLMCIVGMLEGMQIAFFAVAKLPASSRGTTFFGRKTCDLLFKGNGQNLPGFMIGRQLTVVASFFIVASITSMNIQPGNEDGNIFGVSDGAQAFLNLGFHAAVITTILASITWQLAASAFPIAFLNNPATYVLLCFALFLEWTGLCAGAWVLARVMKKALKYEYDEVYVGTPEERAANNHADKDFADDTGKLYGGGFRGHAVGSHDALDGPIQSKDDFDEEAAEETPVEASA